MAVSECDFLICLNIQDCREKTRRTSGNIVGSAFQSLGPLHKADEGTFFFSTDFVYFSQFFFSIVLSFLPYYHSKEIF